MEDQQPATRFVRYNGEELTREEATSGSYVLIDADIVYAFSKKDGEREIAEWAMRHGLSDWLERTRRSAELDVEAERAESEQLKSELDALSAEINVPVEAPGFLGVARHRGIVVGARLSRAPAFGAPRVEIRRSIADVPGLTGWAEGARGCEPLGSATVLLFEGTNFGPNPLFAAATLAGGKARDFSPLTFKSVRFI
jgi:hypothetical protein